jgi:hypothetical protein
MHIKITKLFLIKHSNSDKWKDFKLPKHLFMSSLQKL